MNMILITIAVAFALAFLLGLLLGVFKKILYQLAKTFICIFPFHFCIMNFFQTGPADQDLHIIYGNEQA